MPAARFPFRDVTVGTLLTRLAEEFPDREALAYPGEAGRWTFATLERDVRVVARGLVALGVNPGDRVAVWATNVPQWILLQFALAKIGAILVTVNTALRGQEIDYVLRQSEASTLVTIGGFRGVSYLDELRSIGAIGDPSARRARFPHLSRVVFIGQDPPHDGLIPCDRLRDLAPDVPDDDLQALQNAVGVDDVINMQYTSGTTGFPKGVMLSSRNIVNNGYWLGEGLAYTPADRVCLCVPLFHCFGCVIGVLGAYTHGACLCPVEFFDARRVLETVERERCTALYGVPTMFLAELEDPEFGRFDLTSLRTGVMAGALCPEPLMRRVIDAMHLPEMTIAYGLTETSPAVTQTPRDATIEERTQTVGRVLPEVEVRIVDAAGHDVPPGERGELWARGYVVMKGYYNMPEATAAAITPDGWLRSGDQASFDSGGNVRITGRIKDLIIRGGENVAPKEIEDVLRLHPAVLDVSVYAVGSEFFGEEVAAAIRVRPDARLDADTVVGFCRARLARFKVPRYVRFVDAFPMTASGKIQKFRLREAHEAELQATTGGPASLQAPSTPSRNE
jgi:fatty-acyl-CoA synthase